MIDVNARRKLRRKLAARARKTRPVLTKEQREQLVIDFIAMDLSVAEVARRYGVTRQTAAYHLRRNS